MATEGWKTCVVVCGCPSMFRMNIALKSAFSKCPLQVWRPDQDVLRRLRHLEYACTNSSLTSAHHLADIRVHVLAELMRAQNMSNSIERELLEQKL